MDRERTIKAYLAGLTSANNIEILKLFADDATVSSPLYGKMSAVDFYKQLFADTSESKIDLKDIFVKVSDPSIFAAHFIYDWKLRNGQEVSFRCMDIFKFENGSDKIRHLTIIYDSSRTRDAFDKVHHKAI